MNFDNLNPKQRQIVEAGDGVVIVKAGPGTGKTKTLTSRAAFLIKGKNVPVENILVLTFTNRAAREMQERLKEMVGRLPQVATFHGFCYELLTKLGAEINLISEDSKEEIIKAIKKQQKSRLSVKDLGLKISRYKNSCGGDVERKIKELVDLYQKELEKRDLWDFDDLILQAFKKINEDEKLKEDLKKRFIHILIDEFQDTNSLQYQLIKLLLGKNPNLFVIGDPCQSIYGFRGANSGIFETLKKDFPENKEESLAINYRSFASIVNVSNLVFKGVSLSPFFREAGKVSLLETFNEYSEADFIIGFINQKIGGVDLLDTSGDTDENATFDDFAIIYRTHNLSRVLEKRLSNSGLPYQIVKEDSLVEGDHIKLLSIHAAKGLEFKYAFICGFEEGLIPYTKAVEDPEDLEEEKRLLYVAMTRAKNELYLIWAKKRNKKETVVSRFKALLISPYLTQIKGVGKNSKRKSNLKQLGLFKL